MHAREVQAACSSSLQKLARNLAQAAFLTKIGVPLQRDHMEAVGERAARDLTPAGRCHRIIFSRSDHDRQIRTKRLEKAWRIRASRPSLAQFNGGKAHRRAIKAPRCLLLNFAWL